MLVPSQAGAYARRVIEAANNRAIREHALRVAGAAEEDRDSGPAFGALRTVIEGNAADLTGNSSWRPREMAAVGDGYFGPETDILSRTDGLCLLYPGKVNAVYGEPETGKSWLAIAASAEVLSAGLPVAYFDFEESAEVAKDRLRRFGVDDRLIHEHLRYIQPDAPFTDADLAMLRRDVLPGVVLAVVDATVTGMALDGLDPISTADFTMWHLRLPRASAAAGAAVFLLDHVTKAAETRGRWAVGPQAKLAVVTGAAYTLTGRQVIAPGHVGSSSLTISKDRHASAASSWFWLRSSWRTAFGVIGLSPRCNA